MILYPNAKFEKLEHTVYGGEHQQVPIYIDRIKGLTDESNALLQASNIIGGNLELFNHGLDEIVDKVGLVVSNPDSEGFVVADSEGAGSVQIKHETSTITSRAAGQWMIPSTLLFDMVYEWNEYISQGKGTE